MILHFRGGKTSNNLSIIKETKKYITLRCHDNTMKYRYNKETGEIQNGTYHNVIKGMWLELQEVKKMDYDIIWSEEEEIELEELNDIFNLQEDKYEKGYL